MAARFCVSPEELYFLGELLHADHLDYAYLAAMDKNIAGPLMEKESKASLVNRNILFEDFSGELSPNGDYLELLDPVFFGALETLALGIVAWLKVATRKVDALFVVVFAAAVESLLQFAVVHAP